MTTPKGWCPSLWRPMPVEDGLLVRLRPHMGRLTAAQVRGICDLAQAHGSGVLEVTNRASLQIRGVDTAGHVALLNGMEALGLRDPDLETETRRSLLVTPFWDSGDLTHRLAMSFLQRLSGLPRLPAKFGFVLDTGPTPCLQDTPGDIRIEWGADTLVLRADGMETGRATTEEAVWDDAIGLAQWFNDNRSPERRRMGVVVAHNPLPAMWQGTPPSGPAAHTAIDLHQTSLGDGRTDTLALARLMQHSGATALRLTPWRAVLLEGTRAAPKDISALTTEAT